MRNLIVTLCLTIAVLLWGAGGSWGADFQKGLTAYKSGDYATALREWKALAELGDAGAQSNLGLMYDIGKGVPEDDKEAVKWYRLAAEQGHASAQYLLGMMYDDGDGVPEDDKEAMKWYRLAAEQGHASAQYHLGLMYDNGDGVPEDDKEAVKWYKLAGEQGNVDAQKKVQEFQKKIAEQNELRELQARAKRGDADAQFGLGLMYDMGKGVSEDDKEAVKWYKLAAEQGNADAQERYGELVLQDFVYGSDIRKLENLGKSVETLCKRNIKCAFIKVWAYLDITKDGHLSLSEIARFQRNIVKFAAVHQDQKVLKTEDIAAINLASIMFLPITASAILHSFDYNNDGLLSKNEVLDDTEFSKLVGVNVNTLATGLDFQSLGEKLKDSMNLMPFLK